MKMKVFKSKLFSLLLLLSLCSSGHADIDSSFTKQNVNIQTTDSENYHFCRLRLISKRLADALREIRSARDLIASKSKSGGNLTAAFGAVQMSEKLLRANNLEGSLESIRTAKNLLSSDLTKIPNVAGAYRKLRSAEMLLSST